MLIREIGLEREFWLLDKSNNIVEAPMYNFPADEMGFLVEVRSAWGNTPHLIVNTLDVAETNERRKANRLGFKVLLAPEMKVTDEWQSYIAQKYKHSSFGDSTQNIYGKSEHSHNTGLLPGRATAGMHIHFSIWDSELEKFLDFNDKEIRKVISYLDDEFKDLVVSNKRNLGEWEPKKHGFEYRSLPCTAKPYEVAVKGLNVLEELSF
jgi:hypothetical protein